MEKCITYVGLDVHKNSIEISLADWGRDNEVRHYGSVGGDLHSLDKVVRRLVSQGSLREGCVGGNTALTFSWLSLMRPEQDELIRTI